MAKVVVASTYVWICLLVCTPFAHAATDRAVAIGNNNAILLNSRTIDTSRSKFRGLDDNDAADQDDPAQRRVTMVQFDSPLDRARLERVEARHGVALAHYLPYNAYVVYVNRSARARLQAAHGVTWIGSLEPGDKYSAASLDLIDQEQHSCLIVLHPADADVSEWPATLARSLNVSDPGVQLRKLAANRNEVCCTFDVPGTPRRALIHSFLRVLASLPNTIHIDVRPVRQLANKWARPLLQSGVADMSRVNLALSQLDGLFALDGAGQIIGIGDTGIDSGHTFFADPSVPIPYREYSTDGRVPASGASFDARHRKVVQYVTFADKSDRDGHGTHVAGSLAGAPFDLATAASVLQSNRMVDEFSGIAHAARLAFFDIADPDQSDDLIIPSMLDETYFGWAYAAGARIHSNSWGSHASTYTVESYDVDLYSWEHKDFLAIFSAGNNGTVGASTITAPANAKNVIAVGSSISSNAMFREVFCQGGLQPDSSICNQVNRNEKFFTENDIAQFSSIGPSNDGRIKPDLVAPGLYVYSSQASGTYLRANATWSSKLGALAGTSMSAPLVAGTVALIRQYFTDGLFPYGSAGRSEHSINPSGALLKAMMISGCVPLTGFRDVAKSRDGTPDLQSIAGRPNNHQGFGRPELSHVLKFANSTNFDLLIAGTDLNRAPIQADPVMTKSGQFHQYKICTISTSKHYQPKITLVWTDYPGSPIAQVALVNDLDLLVELVGINRTAVGSSRKFFPNGLDKPDHMNTIERIELLDARRYDVYIITVTTASLPMSPQPYALVITGQVRTVPVDAPCVFMATADVFSDQDMRLVPLSRPPSAPVKDGSLLDDIVTWIRSNQMLLAAMCIVGTSVFLFILCKPRRRLTGPQIAVQASGPPPYPGSA